MRQYRPGAVDFYKAGGEGQVGIPYAIYPSVLCYKADMFKEAGLNRAAARVRRANTRCPTAPRSTWDYDTVREIAKILTVDANGKDATQEGFDPEKIVQ